LPNLGNGVEDTLWVDRYRPRRFTDLMGNERVARETMTWVKQWDWCVFGSKKGKKRPRDGDENHDENDEYHRPREKVPCIILRHGISLI
jgi:chromosome transmission fidelity protein 18